MAITPVRRDAQTAEFFDGTAAGEFRLKRSAATGEVLAPQVLRDSIGSSYLEWIVASGEGRVVSWATSYRKPVDGVQVPNSVIAIVELAEGPWWWCELLDADPSLMREGLPVRVGFVRPEGSEEAIPVFRILDDQVVD